MNFLDKYWDVAAKIRSRAARSEFIVACVEYYYTGGEPTFKSEVADVAFEGIRNLLDTSRKQSETGQRSRPAKTEPNANQTLTKTEPNANQTLTKTEPNANQTLTLEQEQVTSKETSPNGEVKKAPSRFRPPTADEVRGYAEEKGLSMDPDRFCDFYASKGWQVGKSPMKDWKAAARNWAARARKEEGRGAAYDGDWADAW